MDLLSKSNYGGRGKIATNNLWWTSAMRTIMYVPREEQIFSGLADSSGRKMVLRTQQTSVKWMIGLLGKFCKAG